MCQSGNVLFIQSSWDKFIILDNTSNSLPVLGSLIDFLPPEAFSFLSCKSIAVIDPIVYVATGVGIIAINFEYPNAPFVAGMYEVPEEVGGLPAADIECVDNRLYVLYQGGNSSSYSSAHSEILKPVFFSGAVYFNSICSDFEDPPSLDPNLDLTASSSSSLLVPAGRPRGYYSFGMTTDSTLVVLNTYDPVDPTVIKEIVVPLSLSGDTPSSNGHNITSYCFDDQYIYLTSKRWEWNQYSPIHVYDIYSEGNDPVYSVGDIYSLGDDKAGAVETRGKYLYYYDKVSGDTGEHMLQIFEKVHGCDDNLAIQIGPVPIADIYEVG